MWSREQALAYALMTNHVHLLLTPPANGSPARLMQPLGRRYVQYSNRFYRRIGSLGEGRYKSSLVQAETYLLAYYHHIEINPVHADMVADPHQSVMRHRHRTQPWYAVLEASGHRGTGDTAHTPA